jgi:NAD-dependent SIR2 family protein deacetylase
MKIETAEIVHVYPTEVWFEKDFFGTVHIKMQHMAPDTVPFTFVTINYDYAYTSNSHQRDFAKKIGELLGQPDIQERPWTPPESWYKKVLAVDGEEAECYCYNCNKDRVDKTGFPVTMTRMILCPTCGNKRCPHATDHTLECTGSNEPGQPGSRY